MLGGSAVQDTSNGDSTTLSPQFWELIPFSLRSTAALFRNQALPLALGGFLAQSWKMRGEAHTKYLLRTMSKGKPMGNRPILWVGPRLTHTHQKSKSNPGKTRCSSESNKANHYLEVDRNHDYNPQNNRGCMSPFSGSSPWLPITSLTRPAPPAQPKACGCPADAQSHTRARSLAGKRRGCPAPSGHGQDMSAFPNRSLLAQ